jgi:hypothetical protein
MRVKALRTNVAGRLRELQSVLNSVLNSDAISVKPYWAKHVEKIVMEPHGKMYVAAGVWNLLGETLGMCRGGELNSLRRPFQGRALPVSYPGTGAVKDCRVALKGCQLRIQILRRGRLF